MHRLPVALIAAVSSIGLVQIASAADLPVKVPVVVAPAAPSWTGFYVGANFGGGWGRRSVGYSPNDPVSVILFDPASLGAPPPPGSFTSSGVLGGLQLGYNWQFNRNWLFGLETDFDWSGIKGSDSPAGINGGAPITAPVDERIKWFGTVRARLGYLPMDNLLAYVTGGFAYGRVEHSASFVNGPAGGFGIASGGIAVVCAASATCFTGSSSSVATGWTLGGGFEYAFAQHWTFKGEYLYVSLRSPSLTETALVSASFAPSTFTANFSRTNFNVARVGVNYRF